MQVLCVLVKVADRNSKFCALNIKIAPTHHIHLNLFYVLEYSFFTLIHI